jgi:pantoate--beta-alanine ligase
MIERLERVDEVRDRLDRVRRGGGGVGFVPTLGALHDGHAALLRRAVSESSATVLSVFVNPLQFAEGEDFDAYPRDLERDLAFAASLGVTFAFTPPLGEMYPRPPVTTVSVGDVTSGMEGERRPGHFSGVATVVAKLFTIVGPCRAYFGEKDWQQLQLVRRMVEDLSMPVTVVGCPTVRDEHGVALSSRLAYLDDDERQAARVVHAALLDGREGHGRGEDALAVARRRVAAEPGTRLSYVAVRDDRLHIAVYVGSVCLIDNLGLADP